MSGANSRKPRLAKLKVVTGPVLPLQHCRACVRLWQAGKAVSAARFQTSTKDVLAKRPFEDCPANLHSLISWNLMKTQFAISLSLLIIGGMAIAALVAWTLYQLSKGRDLSLKSRALTICVLSVGLVISGLKFAQASWVLAQTGAGKVKDVGQELVSTNVEVGSIGVLEGVGRAREFYEGKWGAKEKEALAQLVFGVESVETQVDSGQGFLVVMLRIQNNGDSKVDLNTLLRKQHIVVKSTTGLCFPISQLEYKESHLPPGIVSGRQLKIQVPGDVELASLVTPSQEVPLVEGE